MNPLNRSERNGAFWRFLLLFLITIVLVVTVFYFSGLVTLRENRDLRERVAEMQSNKLWSASFTRIMQEAMDELSTFETSSGLAPAKYQKVQFKVKEMYQMINAIPDGKNTIYALIVRNIQDLNDAKMAISHKQQFP